MCERITGSITTIYVRVRDTYWRLDDKITTSHKELLNKVEIAIKSTLAETA